MSENNQSINPHLRDTPLPRIDPYTASQLVAAAMVIAIPTLLAFVLGAVLDTMQTGVIWASIVGIIAGSVIATSTLVTYVGVLTAVLGISGVWGLTVLLLVWILPSCPTLLGGSCGPRQYATAMAVGMLAPWVLLVFVAPLVVGIHALVKIFTDHTS